MSERVASLINLGGNPYSSSSSEDISHLGLRPLPGSRDQSSLSPRRHPSAEFYVPSSGQHSRSSSAQHSRSASRDQSPGAQVRYPGQAPYSSSSSSNPRPQPHVRSFSGPFPVNSHSRSHSQAIPYQDEVTLPPPPRIGEVVSNRNYSPGHSRAGSKAESHSSSRPPSPAHHLELLRPTTPSEKRLSKKKSWLPGKLHGRTASGSIIDPGPLAWIISPVAKTIYDISYLANGQVNRPALRKRILMLTEKQVPELWDDRGDTFVHLFSKDASEGPSFRINSSLIASSKTLTSFMRGDALTEHNQHDPRQNSSIHLRQVPLKTPPEPFLSPPISSIYRSISGGSDYDGRSEGHSEGSASVRDYFDVPQSVHHLYLPLGINPIDPLVGLSTEETESLVAIRNLFAFLSRQILVGTPGQPDAFSVLSNTARLLEHYEFSNLDGSTWGEVPSLSFKRYIEELDLADVRVSRIKTMEAIILGERMKSWELYTEGFVHGVGKWDDLVALDSPLYQLISEVTRKRMERAANELFIRRRAMESRLELFEFPSLWSGVADSYEENKRVDFKAWKASFFSMRKYMLAFYKQRYGSWPPKAKSKKNQFEESGLNRLLLREVYQDFSHLYDLMVERKEVTTRTADFLLHDGSSMLDPTMPTPHVLRRLLGEFDRADPPVQPPIPFDTPMMPSLINTRRDFDSLPAKKQAKESHKKLKDNEINQALLQAVNRDSIQATPFIEHFLSFERHSAHGKSIQDIADLRIGQWIFSYTILQSLPLMVIDAPGIKYSEGVEYFLCQVPKEGSPWVKEDPLRNKAWYGVAGGQALVNLPAHVVDYGVDGIYRRSHCWRAAEKWLGGAGVEHDEPVFASSDPSTSASETSGARSGLNFSLPLPPPIDPDVVLGARSDSPDGGHSSRDSVSSAALISGLEALPLPSGVSPTGSRPISTYDPNKSFDQIVGAFGSHEKKKKKQK